MKIFSMLRMRGFMGEQSLGDNGLERGLFFYPK